MTAATAHLVLIGMMGSGKTVVGRACAERLGRPFLDTDELVEAAAGLPVPEIFAAEGEDGFRRREAQAVADACSAREASVIGCGGGAVLDPRTRSRIRQAGFVVWIAAPPATLAARVGSGAGRPLLAGAPPSAELERLLELREPAYRDAAHAVVDSEGRSVDAVATAVLDAYAAHAEQP